ncbi:MAG TPA: c-type cytochrome, partial [Aggregatilineales bacterium]|nr:c-type cytochrome [Aggregatilineales bacterium]
MQRTHLQRLLIITAASSLILAACISTSSEPEIISTQIVASPEPVQPPEQFDLVEGASLYASSCAPCHGETGLGDGPSAPAFSCEVPAFANFGATIDLLEWFDTASNGKRSSDTCIMPPWSGRLNQEQIWHAVAYAARLRFDDEQQTPGGDLVVNNQT